jgi:osmotically-inducible protein OsmY
LAQDLRIARLPIKVSVLNREVILTGTVNVSSEKKAAERDAANTVGVIRVSNKIQLDKTFRTDESLEEELTVDLGADALLHHQNIRANVVKSAATLSGIVNNLREYNRAEVVVKRVRGVREVVNLLDIERRDTVADADALSRPFAS